MRIADPSRFVKVSGTDSSGPANEVHICGLVVYVQPDTAEATSNQLQAVPGLEIHAADPCGKLVVTLETEKLDDVEAVGRVPGVLLSNLVYHHCESEQKLAEELDHEDHPS